MDNPGKMFQLSPLGLPDCKGFKQLLDSQSLVDCTLACDGGKISAHKIVLSACSSYLAKILLEHPVEHPIIILPELSIEDVRTLVHYMYTGDLLKSTSTVNSISLLRTAAILSINSLNDLMLARGSSATQQQQQPGCPSSPASSSSSLPVANLTQSPGASADTSPLLQLQQQQQQQQQQHTTVNHHQQLMAAAQLACDPSQLASLAQQEQRRLALVDQISPLLAAFTRTSQQSFQQQQQQQQKQSLFGQAERGALGSHSSHASNVSTNSSLSSIFGAAAAALGASTPAGCSNAATLDYYNNLASNLAAASTPSLASFASSSSASSSPSSNSNNLNLNLNLNLGQPGLNHLQLHNNSNSNSSYNNHHHQAPSQPPQQAKQEPFAYSSAITGTTSSPTGGPSSNSTSGNGGGGGGGGGANSTAAAAANELQFKCPTCQSHCQTICSFEYHMQRAHSVTSFCCEICHKPFASLRYVLTDHMRRCHGWKGTSPAAAAAAAAANGSTRASNLVAGQQQQQQQQRAAMGDQQKLAQC
ncbi:sal 3 [Olea europaea subsp. europaea]|uniref:Sal 3 n=1 Tax=Olea europaea subsp. europaea TaxID=158383 RepID=A0A8S0Q7C6_OLEEU|nr:sal 3 [Olea europaea subsp. europaea]